MNEPGLDIDKDGHGAFRDICTRYGDHHRAVFLEQVLDSFIRGAAWIEIAAIRRAIRRREAQLKTEVTKKGRPPGREDQNWRRKAFRTAWRKDVMNMTWPDIAKAERLTPDKTAFRTLQRRRDQYAVLVWRALPTSACATELMEVLKRKEMQSLLRRETDMPFDAHPEECQKLVLALVNRGRRIDGNELAAWAKRSRKF